MGTNKRACKCTHRRSLLILFSPLAQQRNKRLSTRNVPACQKDIRNNWNSYSSKLFISVSPLSFKGIWKRKRFSSGKYYYSVANLESLLGEYPWTKVAAFQSRFLLDCYLTAILSLSLSFSLPLSFPLSHTCIENYTVSNLSLFIKISSFSCLNFSFFLSFTQTLAKVLLFFCSSSFFSSTFLSWGIPEARRKITLWHIFFYVAGHVSMSAGTFIWENLPGRK